MLMNIWNRKGFGCPRSQRIATLALAIAYPLLAHGASLVGSPALTIASVAVLASAILIRPLTEGRLWSWFALPLVAFAIFGLWRIDAAALVLFLPPIVLNVFLAWLFGHTLVLDRIPLLERMVRLLQPPGEPPAPDVIRYVGRLTRAWTGLFVGLAAVNLGLAACATPGGLLDAAGFRAPFAVSRETWSLFANVVNYAIVAAFFLLEFAYRMRRFPGRPYRNLADFLRRAMAAGPALAATLGSESPTTSRETFEFTLDVPIDHPSFAGHFPGRPVLPGVVLLERVIEAAEKLCGGPLAILELPRAKFLSPLVPGDSASIRLRLDSELLHFDVRRGETRISQGVFRIGSGKPG